jgi:hypothetical protein
MSTPAQAQASRANGALSQGPVTPEGKAASSQNALRHGLRSAAVVLPTEDREEFAEHQAAYVRRFRPIDPPERDLVEAMAAAQWRLRRLIVIETQLLQDGDPAVALGIITRYEGQLNRSYDRAFKHLEALKATRPPASRTAPAKPQEAAAAPAETSGPNEPDERQFEALLHALTAPPTLGKQAGK